MRIRRVAAVMLTAVLMAPGWAGRSATADPGYPAPPASNAAYRVLGWNTQLRPAIVGDAAEYNVDNETRADRIASAILSGGYDIVVLQEVFHEPARQILIDRLSATYPTLLPKFDGYGIDVFEDGGLVIASKFPLVEVDTPPGGECRFPGSDGKCRAGYHVFTDGRGADALANKGIAAVRLKNPTTGRQIDVFGTHLQATTGTDDAADREVRRQQIIEARTFITAWAPPGNRDALILGDLNIAGPPAPGGVADEYYENLAGANGLGGLGFHDAYNHAALGADPMTTFDGKRNIAAGNTVQRLDYAFLRPATGQQTCVAHHRLRRDFRIEQGTGADYTNIELSDHYPVDLTFGPPTPQCSPDQAKPIAGDTELAQRIETPGAVQWFRVDQPGTYSFDIADPTNANLRKFGVEAYRTTDLSTAEKPYDGVPSLIDTPTTPFSNRVVYAMDAPFLVRVNGTVGDYILRIHRHAGASFTDAIALDPFTPLGQKQLHSPPATGQSTVYYSLIQHPLDSGASQQLAFQTTGHPDMPLRLRLFDALHNELRSTGYAAPGQTLSVRNLSGTQQRLFLAVDRDGCGRPFGCVGQYTVQWTTNYRRLDLHEAFVRDFDANRTRVYVRVDGGAERVADLGSFDAEPIGRGLPANVRSLGFSGSVQIRFETHDGDGASDPLAPVTAGQIPVSDSLDTKLIFTIRRNANPVGTIAVPVLGRANVHS